MRSSQAILKAAVAMGLLASPTDAHARRPDGGPILIDQGGRRYPIHPLRGADSVVDFYSYSVPYGASANTAEGLEVSGLSQIFFYQDDDGNLSLVIVHDRFVDGSGGQVTFAVDGLPDTATVAVADDPSDVFAASTFAPPTATFIWGWAPCCTDGVAVSLPPDFDITITPDFRTGIDGWFARSEHPDGSLREVELDPSRPLRLVTPGFPPGRN